MPEVGLWFTKGTFRFCSATSNTPLTNYSTFGLKNVYMSQRAANFWVRLQKEVTPASFYLNSFFFASASKITVLLYSFISNKLVTLCSYPGLLPQWVCVGVTSSWVMTSPSQEPAVRHPGCRCWRHLTSPSQSVGAHWRVWHSSCPAAN